MLNVVEKLDLKMFFINFEGVEAITTHRDN